MKNFVNSLFKGIKKLFSKKLFLISLSLYILIPILTICIIKAENKYRTAGTYVCYQGNVILSKIILEKDNGIKIFNYDPKAEKDSEFVHKDNIVSWGYRVSSWSDNYDPSIYHYLSKEYILFCGASSNSYVAFFKIGNKFYSSYLLPEERGGGQKCYAKI